MPYNIGTRIDQHGNLVVDVIKTAFPYSGGYVTPEKAQLYYDLIKQSGGSVELYDIFAQVKIYGTAEMSKVSWWVNNASEARELMAGGYIAVDHNLIRKSAPDICKFFAKHVDINGNYFVENVQRSCKKAPSYQANLKTQRNTKLAQGLQKRQNLINVLLPKSLPGIRAAAINAAEEDMPHVVSTEQKRLDLEDKAAQTANLLQRLNGPDE
jgi:hypothetical protein